MERAFWGEARTVNALEGRQTGTFHRASDDARGSFSQAPYHAVMLAGEDALGASVKWVHDGVDELMHFVVVLTLSDVHCN